MRTITFTLTFFLISIFSFSQDFKAQEYYKLDSNGVLQGAYLMKCNDNLLAQGYFQNGNRAGKWTFYNYEGQKIIEGFYLNGLMNGQWKYYKDNKIISKIGYRLGILHGQVSSYYSNGNARTIFNYNNGVLNDTLTVFDNNGVVRIKVVFDNDRPVSILKTNVVDNFNFSFKGNLLNGTGKYEFYKRWSGDMVLLEERNYVNGKLNGKYKSYKNGVELISGNIEDDILVGKWKFNNQYGTLVEKKEFEPSDSVSFFDIANYHQSLSNYNFTTGFYFIADYMPKFLGQEISKRNDSGIFETTSDDLKNEATNFDTYLHSEIAKLNINSKGNVFVEFTVGLLGEVKDVKIVRGFSESENEQILNIFRSLPFFEPGYLNGFPVNVKFTKPINFN